MSFLFCFLNKLLNKIKYLAVKFMSIIVLVLGWPERHCVAVYLLSDHQTLGEGCARDIKSRLR